MIGLPHSSQKTHCCACRTLSHFLDAALHFGNHHFAAFPSPIIPAMVAMSV